MYSRQIDGKILNLTPSCWTYGVFASRSLFVLMDKETQSLWFPMEKNGEHSLVGITGYYADRKLRTIQRLSKMKWSEWLERFPDTLYVIN